MTPAVHIVPTLRDNYCYLLEGADKRCIIVDPGEVKSVTAHVGRLGLSPALILNTHHHADHVAGNGELKKLYAVPVIGPRAEEKMIPHLTASVVEGESVQECGLDLNVIATPGHTKGHIVFYEAALGWLFSGDTLFSMGCGRLLEGTAEDMYESLQKLNRLPPETALYCGHEYTAANGDFAASLAPESTALKTRREEVRKLRLNNMPTLPVTLATERETNPFLMARSLDEFTDLRLRKDTF